MQSYVTKGKMQSTKIKWFRLAAYGCYFSVEKHIHNIQNEAFSPNVKCT